MKCKTKAKANRAIGNDGIFDFWFSKIMEWETKMLLPMKMKSTNHLWIAYVRCNIHVCCYNCHSLQYPSIFSVGALFKFHWCLFVDFIMCKLRNVQEIKCWNIFPNPNTFDKWLKKVNCLNFALITWECMHGFDSTVDFHRFDVDVCSIYAILLVYCIAERKYHVYFRKWQLYSFDKIS